MDDKVLWADRITFELGIKWGILMLIRSRNSPLVISAFVDRDTIAVIMKVIRLHLSRMKKLVLSGSVHLLSGLANVDLCKPAPLMSELELIADDTSMEDTEDSDESESEEDRMDEDGLPISGHVWLLSDHLLLGGAPLRRFSLTSFPLPRCFSLLQNLVEFTLIRPYYYDNPHNKSKLPHLFDILLHIPKIQKLTLNDCIGPEDIPPDRMPAPQSIVLDYLVFINVIDRATACTTIFNSLSFPPSASVAVELLTKFYSWYIPDISGESSACRLFRGVLAPHISQIHAVSIRNIGSHEDTTSLHVRAWRATSEHHAVPQSLPDIPSVSFKWTPWDSAESGVRRLFRTWELSDIQSVFIQYPSGEGVVPAALPFFPNAKSFRIEVGGRGTWSSLLPPDP